MNKIIISIPIVDNSVPVNTDLLWEGIYYLVKAYNKASDKTMISAAKSELKIE